MSKHYETILFLDLLIVGRFIIRIDSMEMAVWVVENDIFTIFIL